MHALRRGRSRLKVLPPQPLAASLTGQVLCLVLERLDVPSRCGAACVCRDWCSEVSKPAAWRCLSLPPWFTDERLARAVAKSGGKLHSLRLDGCTDVTADGFGKALSPRSAPLLRDLVIVNGSRLSASALVATLSRGSLELLSIRGLRCDSTSLASVRELLAPGGVLDVARVCDAPAQLTQEDAEGSWMGRCSHLGAASDDDDAPLCDVCQVVYCPACVALMEERNGWVSKTCGGAGCQATVCSRCIFEQANRNDAEEDPHAVSRCVTCEKTLCPDCAVRACAAEFCGGCFGDVCVDCVDEGVHCENHGDDYVVCKGFLCRSCADESVGFCERCGKSVCEGCTNGLPGCDMIYCGGYCSYQFCEKCAFGDGALRYAHEDGELFNVRRDDEGDESHPFCEACLERLRLEVAAKPRRSKRLRVAQQ